MLLVLPTCLRSPARTLEVLVSCGATERQWQSRVRNYHLLRFCVLQALLR